MAEAGIDINQAGREKLRQTVTKIEKLEEEKREVGGQIKDVYDEAKSMGVRHEGAAPRDRASQGGPPAAGGGGRHPRHVPPRAWRNLTPLRRLNFDIEMVARVRVAGTGKDS